jgi:hypothetical protein
MFPRFSEQLGTALDLIVEFSTLGEYRVGAHRADRTASAPAVAPDRAPQLGGAGSPAGRAAVRRTVAGGATGATPVATPAARRALSPDLGCHGDRRRTTAGEPRRRRGAPAAPEQLCLAS